MISPEQIIGRDALAQLIFEGYVVLPSYGRDNPHPSFDPECADCDRAIGCTMNCGPRVPPTKEPQNGK